ncbi:MAG: TetR/AcrR family transcriptional regulator C-terminal domain-containing protein [Tissierellia bacterium]|nr:TetR/AcrR family transcriptional regulator C-terminal domain-containing protein [Tissierellia bacterium]
MSDSLITKKALAKAVKELMEVESFHKINIKSICDICGLSRKTFYYHFSDKYDLLNWIFQTEFFADYVKMSEANDSWQKLNIMLNFFYKHKRFYQNALEYTGQNSFYEYLFETLNPLLEDYVLENFYYIDEQNEEDYEFYVNFYTSAIRYLIVDWLREGAKIEPDKLTTLIRNAITKVALNIVEDLHSD